MTTCGLPNDLHEWVANLSDDDLSKLWSAAMSEALARLTAGMGDMADLAAGLDEAVADLPTLTLGELRQQLGSTDVAKKMNRK